MLTKALKRGGQIKIQSKDIIRSIVQDSEKALDENIKQESKSSLFGGKPTISSIDLRESPYNLSLNSKQRVLDLKKLQKFTPGDIFQPQRIGALNIKDKISSKLQVEIDEDKNRVERSKITRKILTPYYQDFHDIRNCDGKLFEAIAKEVPEKDALYMPNMRVQPLSTKHPNIQDKHIELMDILPNKITLIAFYLSQYGENQAQSFVQPYLKLLKSAPKDHCLQLLEVNVSEQWVKSLISRLFVSRIRRQLPEERQMNYVLKYGSIEPIKERLAMVNAMIGYVFLVDRNSKIRWYANGEAKDNEVNTLLELSKKLYLNPKV